jgi:hypothetical protein
VADLVTATELAAYLQRDLDTSSATQAVKQASGIVRAWTRQNIDQQTYTGVLLPIESYDWSWGVQLPQRPVTAVTSVAVNGTTYTLGVDYAWNGFSPWIRLAQRTWTTSAWQDEPVATVTYTAGYTTVPDEVKAVVCGVAGRIYDNPTGLRTYAIDDHSETYAGADDQLAGLALLAPERAILKRYRAAAGSVRVK